MAESNHYELFTDYITNMKFDNISIHHWILFQQPNWVSGTSSRFIGTQKCNWILFEPGVSVASKKKKATEKETEEVTGAVTEEESSEMEVSVDGEALNVGHNYTECCQQYNVSSACWGFCNLKSILDGTTGQDADLCEPDFPNIVKCMAGNHLSPFFLFFSITLFSDKFQF